MTKPHESDSKAHIPVLLQSVLTSLAPEPGETVVDCTAGLGGHAKAMGELVGPTGRVVVVDMDPSHVEIAADAVRALPDAPEVVTMPGNYADAPRKLAELGILADVVLADLGFASPHVDNPERGFAFSKDGPLDMRYSPNQSVDAAELVNTLPAEELADLIWRYGEERGSRRIAQKIIEARAAEPITRTGQLAALIRQAVPRSGGAKPIDPATRTFQALRIAVNDELGSVGSLLEAVERGARAVSLGNPSWLNVGARVAVIAFHSLEDRPVKTVFGDLSQQSLVERVTRKPITGSPEEIAQNPRARSAKMRVVRVCGRSVDGSKRT